MNEVGHSMNAGPIRSCAENNLKNITKTRRLLKGILFTT